MGLRSTDAPPGTAAATEMGLRSTDAPPGTDAKYCLVLQQLLAPEGEREKPSTSSAYAPLSSYALPGVGQSAGVQPPTRWGVAQVRALCCYAMSGTAVAYAATKYCESGTDTVYAATAYCGSVSGTDIGYAARAYCDSWCYAQPGTDIPYGPTSSGWPRWGRGDFSREGSRASGRAVVTQRMVLCAGSY
eukprot:1497221-Rhodomonas_salina.2